MVRPISEISRQFVSHSRHGSYRASCGEAAVTVSRISPTMKTLLITLIFLAVQAVDVVAEVTECSNKLESCTNTFKVAEFDNWDALTEYQDCVDAVDCPEDEYATNMKSEMLNDITKKQDEWGRYWNVRDSSPHRGPTLTVLAISALLVFRISSL